MKNNKKSLIVSVIFIVSGALFGFLTNLIYDKFMSAVWSPLAAAIYFTVFAGLLSLLTVVITKKVSNDNTGKTMTGKIAVLLAVIFVVSLLSEFLYELGLNVEISEPDSYILMIDDSGSMQTTDPEKQREKAIEALLRDKPASFSYAVYTFANETKQVRGMLPKSAGQKSMELKSEGGTEMFGCLEHILSDIAAGKLKITSATRVLLLSDGYAGDVPLFKSRVLKKYIDNNMIISTIGLSSGADEKTMKQIAEYTGGVYIHIDDTSMLDTALVDASVKSSERNLLGYRGFCTTDTLHAVLRVVFLLLIIALIYILKLYSYGRYYNPNLIISGILCVIAGILPELALERFLWNDNLVRLLFCILISFTLLECKDPVRQTGRTADVHGYKEYNNTGDSNRLHAEKEADDTEYNSLR